MKKKRGKGERMVKLKERIKKGRERKLKEIKL